MSLKKRYYLRAKASCCWLLSSINQCCHWGQSRQHQIVAFFNNRQNQFLRYDFI